VYKSTGWFRVASISKTATDLLSIQIRGQKINSRIKPLSQPMNNFFVAFLC